MYVYYPFRVERTASSEEFNQSNHHSKCEISRPTCKSIIYFFPVFPNIFGSIVWPNSVAKFQRTSRAVGTSSHFPASTKICNYMIMIIILYIIIKFTTPPTATRKTLLGVVPCASAPIKYKILPNSTRPYY